MGELTTRIIVKAAVAAAADPEWINLKWSSTESSLFCTDTERIGLGDKDMEVIAALIWEHNRLAAARHVQPSRMPACCIPNEPPISTQGWWVGGRN